MHYSHIVYGFIKLTTGAIYTITIIGNSTPFIGGMKANRLQTYMRFLFNI